MADFDSRKIKLDSAVARNVDFRLQEHLAFVVKTNAQQTERSAAYCNGHHVEGDRHN